jgi:peptidoglycan/LPS O-acetylase OafA/YrhL
LSKFWIRRFARIYPSHVAVWLLVLLLPVAAGLKDLRHATLNLLLLHAWSTNLDDVFSMNGVTWSLSCEVFFYAMFPLLYVVTDRLRLRTQWVIAVTLFLAATALVVAGSLALETGRFALFVGANPLVRIPEFILGVVGARTLQARWVVPYWAAAPAVAFCAIGLFFYHGSPSGNSWTAPVWLVLIVLVAQAAVRGKEILARPSMVYAGKVSFAFYLVHQLVLHEIFRFLGAGRWQTVVAFGAACGCAALLHRFVEVPAHHAIVVRFAASKQTMPSDGVVGRRTTRPGYARR